MDTPSQALAQRITARLASEGLLSVGAAKALQAKLADGTLRAEDWRLPVELGLKKETQA
jgi:hypothetical protein